MTCGFVNEEEIGTTAQFIVIPLKVAVVLGEGNTNRCAGKADEPRKGGGTSGCIA